ncbi:MAG: MAPEG family protein [Zhongshania sp.]|uniref:MAPEG family protein n=1 Tax=Zhongshania sp. TaxID=1971902 RepID=UPI00260C8145|nr:MAPEG family protein [Zhongshania sp.]MDF1692184.1 MAPEG family protein [Zhongshania sp.]
MALVAVVMSLILIEYFVFVMLVGVTRGKTGIQAPAMTGDPKLERMLRVQLNTLEQMVLVIPAMWLFAMYVSAPVAAGLGGVFVIGRALYCKGYMAAAAKRSLGFGIGGLATIILVFGSLIGSAMAAFAG